MKTIIKTVVLFFLAGIIIGQTNDSYILKIGDTELGGYVGLNTKFTSVDSDAAGFLEARAAITFDGKWAVGLDFSGLHYDYKLDEIVNEGTYHLNSGYAGIFVERIFPLSENLKLSASILFAQGFINYLYDKDYRADKNWYERKIDEDFYHLFEPQIEIQYCVGNHWWIGVNGSYRFASPIELKNSDENLLRNFGAGLTIKYGLF
jgi:hypothetical protein